MKRTVVIFLNFIFITSILAAAEPSKIVEMRMTENWRDLPDTEEIAVLWFTDVIALLAVTDNGMNFMAQHGIRYEVLNDFEPEKEYYIVESKESFLAENLSGVALVTGQHLVAMQAGDILPPRRNFHMQRITPSSLPISALNPPEYKGYASKIYSSAIQSFVDQVSEARLYNLLEHMVGFQTRFSSSQGCLNAVNWAASEFESWGYDVDLHPHTSGMAPNVIAWKMGFVNPEKIWVVGGHLDSISRQPETLAPGADDNGTGSALTMLCAEILKDELFADTVIYALWTGEEQGLFGSGHWAAWAASQDLDIQGYYNFDMIGWEDPIPEDLDIVVNNASKEFGQDFADVADLYTDLLHVLVVSNMSASDHASFWRNGYIAFCGIEDNDISYPYYHSIEDTIDKISFPFVADVTRAMVANICTAAQLVDTITFKRSIVSCNAELGIFLIDYSATGQIEITIQSDTEPTPETILLTEITDHRFEGSITVTDQAPVQGDKKISVKHGDAIRAHYSVYPDDAVVQVDCESPEIYDVDVTNMSASSFTVTWQTNEPADSIVLWGPASPPSNTVFNSQFGLSHQVMISNLEINTRYYFMVKSQDKAGNLSEDPDDGTYYQATTLNALWSQPVSASLPGRVADQVFPDAATHSSYVVDDFCNDKIWIIEQIIVPGELYNGGASLNKANSLHWCIYADSSGLPSGYPGDNGREPFWSLELQPTSSEVNLIHGIQGSRVDAHLVLDSPIYLPPGTWWLYFYPVMRFQPHGQYGRLSSDTSNLSAAKFINPDGGFGKGTGWNDWSVMGPRQHDAAFEIIGRISTDPTPTPTPGVTGVTITMPSAHYVPGDPCFCTVTVTNAGSEPLIEHPLFLILDAYGELFFGPNFTGDVAWYSNLWSVGITQIEAIPSFIWPDTGTSASGIIWYAALTDPAMTRIFGEWDSFRFGWE